jgi:hypothetical protein
MITYRAETADRAEGLFVSADPAGSALNVVEQR